MPLKSRIISTGLIPLPPISTAGRRQGWGEEWLPLSLSVPVTVVSLLTFSKSKYLIPITKALSDPQNTQVSIWQMTEYSKNIWGVFDINICRGILRSWQARFSFSWGKKNFYWLPLQSSHCCFYFKRKHLSLFLQMVHVWQEADPDAEFWNHPNSSIWAWFWLFSHLLCWHLTSGEGAASGPTMGTDVAGMWPPCEEITSTIQHVHLQHNLLA